MPKLPKGRPPQRYPDTMYHQPTEKDLRDWEVHRQKMNDEYDRQLREEQENGSNCRGNKSG